MTTKKPTASEVAAIVETYEGLIRQLAPSELHTPRANAMFERLIFWRAAL